MDDIEEVENKKTTSRQSLGMPKLWFNTCTLPCRYVCRQI